MTDIKSPYTYSSIKQIASTEQVVGIPFEKLRKIFAADIDSVRQLECIHTLVDLVDCLERRDLLTENDLAPLWKLGRYCRSQRLLHALEQYHVMPKEATPCNEPINQYQELRLAEDLQQQLKINGIGRITSVISKSLDNNATQPVVSPYLVEFTDRKRNAIYKMLSKEIQLGFWRRLGRELEITEGSMDDIELQFPRDVSSRVYKLLQLFEEDECHDKKQNVLLLCRALDQCQRKDLRRKVENIMSH